MNASHPKPEKKQTSVITFYVIIPYSILVDKITHTYTIQCNSFDKKNSTKNTFQLFLLLSKQHVSENHGSKKIKQRFLILVKNKTKINASLNICFRTFSNGKIPP